MVDDIEDPLKENDNDNDKVIAPADMLEASDEDFLDMPVPTGEESISIESDDTENDNKPTDDNDVTDLDDVEKGDDTVDTDKAPIDKDDTPDIDAVEIPSKDSVTDLVDNPKDEVSEEDTKKIIDDTINDVDYKVEYEKLLTPFNANGREMKVKNVDDAINLMKMGANYHKKMVGLKPSLKILKLLENNDLLDPTKINYLIDLHAKNPEAITKLLKDSNIDPLEVDLKKDTTYTPQTRTVSDTEIDLDAVLDDIKSTPTYAQTLNVITEQWDEASRGIISKNPHIIGLINEHISDGTYEKVTGAVNYERSLGRLQGISDLEAYKQIGDAMFAAAPKPTVPTPKAPETPQVTQQSKEKEQKRKERKRAASSTPTAKSTPDSTPFNPLSLSDEEFEKFDITKLHFT